MKEAFSAGGVVLKHKTMSALVVVLSVRRAEGISS